MNGDADSARATRATARFAWTLRLALGLGVLPACNAIIGLEEVPPEGGAPADAAREAAEDGGRDARLDGHRDAADGTIANDAHARPDGAHDATRDSARDAGVDAGPQAPRPLSPLSTSRVTSSSPTLRWHLPPGASGATLDFCNDRSCSVSIATGVAVTGSSQTVTGSLPAGVYFWRLHPSGDSSVTSPTWQFTVGAAKRPDASVIVDTSWGTTFDMNGDGYADLAVGDPGNGSPGAVYVYQGSAAGFTTPPTIVTSPVAGGTGFGYSVASAGDVNGDGFADMVVGAYGVPSAAGTDAGAVYIYLGSATGIGTSPAITLKSVAGAGSAFGVSVASAGDVNGDGYADILVGADTVSNDTGAAYVFFGGPGVLNPTPATLRSPGGSGGAAFGNWVAGAGDVNGDGLGDVVVGAYGTTSPAGSAYVFNGTSVLAPGSTLSSASATISGSGHTGSAVATAGDVNGDGYADILVAADSTTSGDAANVGGIGLFLGGPNGISSKFAVAIAGTGAGDLFGASVASAGDVNGDGYADVVVGAPGGAPSAAFVYLGNGGDAGLGSTPAYALYGTGGDFGGAVSSAGDVTGNGLSAVVVGAHQLGNGMAYVFYGSRSDAGVASFATDASTTLPGTLSDGTAPGFGISVFGATN